MRRTTAGFEKRAFDLQRGHAKVSNTNVHFVVQQEIFRSSKERREKTSCRLRLIAYLTSDHDGYKERMLSSLVIERQSYVPDHVAMAKVQGRDDLSKEFSRLLRCQTAFFDEIIEQFAAGDVLEDEVPESRTDGHHHSCTHGTHRYFRLSYTSYRRNTCGCSINFMMAISRST